MVALKADDRLILVSTNPNKGIEAERILGEPVLRVSLALPEIQANSVEEITRHKLETARNRDYHRLIVEDVALGFDELGNFPGPYVRWLLEAAGGKGLAAIAYALNNLAPLYLMCDPQDIGVHVERSEIEETGDYDLSGLFIRLQYAIDQVGARRPVLVGTSRKRFLGEIAGGSDDPVERDDATLATVVCAVDMGARIVRVHDVGPAVRAVALLDRLADARAA